MPAVSEEHRQTCKVQRKVQPIRHEAEVHSNGPERELTDLHR